MYPKKQTTQMMTHCPTLDRPVTIDDWKFVSISSIEATWWHCPACRGWHAVILDTKQEGDQEAKE